MANGVYNRLKRNLANGTANLAEAGLDLRVMLVNTGYTFNPDHNFIDNSGAGDPIDQEISVVGYTRQALANQAVTQDDTNDFAYLDADDTVFTALAAGQTIGGAIVFDNAGGADTARFVLAFYDLTDTATNGGNVTIQWATPANGGVLKLA
jgi:hypothetical protein